MTKIKIAETYPLRRPKAYPEVLLVSFQDAKQVLENKIGFKCDDCYMEDSALSMVKNKIREVQDKNKVFYSYIFVDLDDVTIIIERFGRALKRIFNENKMEIKDVKLYAFSSTASEKISQHCQRGGFRFYLKPTKAGYLDLLRHMTSEDGDDTDYKTDVQRQASDIKRQATKLTQ
mmetsp:Transcript_5622/g.9693  ORF Transcript_5622/g.9693 Transcript_5622/m.9693 type:complete len:175 (-) Transcript_5622:31-555(-)